MKKRCNMTDMVRAFACANSVIRKRQAAEALGLKLDQVVSAVGTLREQGFLRRISHGVYAYVDQPMAGKEAPINDRIWRGMKIHPVFGCSELARLSGSTDNYVSKLIRQYRNEGLVEAAGRGENLSGTSEKRWRLTARGKARGERPQIKPFEADALVMKTVTLNKLVCSGMAQRLPDARAKAVKLCMEIVAALSDVPMSGNNPPEIEDNAA